MALGKDYTGQDCTLARALEVVGERWTLLIVRDAFYGVRRFSDFLVHLDMPRAVLSARLSTLVEHGVLAKEGHEYVLTEAGLSLWPVVHGLACWGEQNFGELGPHRLFVHADCGTRIAPDGTCPTCGGAPVRPADLEIHPGPSAGLRDDAVSKALRTPHRMLTPIET
ncbi:winged helix-turn-helix transcriptional regulator [Actinomadura rupiterrae]|uniref:winged helix-turn-helix transcriptional regulator n=1 Tax=Actinomadura rupiterrae TaxID=559627 RepID=UPI0020A47E89|nr:helix-turn-helix domain-containing protein [Actinomadura rupiterrae]MCP2339053.1 DNA-binding HxlR family transcriptional regulator [Actinomadura rupiterrae]